jgi:alkylation response protein AidB-like acyl-CoA dehydrogenase
MDFALSNDHILLRDTAASFLDKEISLAPLVVPGADISKAGYAANWEKLSQLGWPGLIIPEVYGGSELDFVNLSMVLGEIGRTLAPSPFLGNLFGTWAVLRTASEEQKQRLLPKVADGQLKLALAVGHATGSDDVESDIKVDASGKLTGTANFVVDGSEADVLIVAAQAASGALGFYAVQADQPSVTREVLPWRDITRQVSKLTLTGAEAEVLTTDFAAHWPWIRDRVITALAVESAAGLRTVLDKTVAYAKERYAFGKPIGAYQSIKHYLADMFAQSECAQVAVLYATSALSDNLPDAASAAAIAQSYASDAYVAGVRRSTQIFGAIGFSWEMVNHLYFKRALGNSQLFGSAQLHRERLIGLALKRAA